MSTRSWALVLMVMSLSVGGWAHAQTYRVGDSFVGFKGVDQHGKEFLFQPGDWRFVIFETPGESGESPPPKDPNWFDKNHALLLINISDFSSFKRRIARGRMESKPFRLLIVDDPNVAARFPQQKDKFTVLRLDDKGVITDVLYPAPGKELQGLIAPEPVAKSPGPTAKGPPIHRGSHAFGVRLSASRQTPCPNHYVSHGSLSGA